MSPQRRSFLLLEAATLVSGVGNGVAMVALPWLALEATGSASAAGIVATAAALPLIAASLVSGTVVDSFGRRRTAVVSDLLSLIAVAAIPIADATVGLSLGLLIVFAALGAAFDPAGITARETLLPAAAHGAGWGLERANSVHEAVWNVAFLVGPGIGGLLIATVGAASTLWVTAAGFALSLALTSRIRVPGAGIPEAHVRPEGFWTGTLEGLRFIRHEPLLRTTALLSMAIVALYLPVEGVILPTYFNEQGQPARLGTVLMALSLGGIAGSLAYGKWGTRLRRRTAFVLAIVGVGVPLFGMALLPPFTVMVLFATIAGFLYGPIAPLENYAMQTRTPEELRGRAFGVLTSAAYAAGPVGYLLVGPLVEALGLRPAFILLSAGLVLVTLAAIPARSLHLLDEPPLYAASPDEDWTPTHSGLPLGEQSVPRLRESAA
ncbi:MAG: MFS transporter [Acidimicrobiales bacterium]